jgi:putative SOS response-associated peptidase YedK
MCTNYHPTSRELIDDYFGASALDIEFREEAYLGYQAPIIRLNREDQQEIKRKECIAATFGMNPPWSKDGKNYRSAYNARRNRI